MKAPSRQSILRYCSIAAAAALAISVGAEPAQAYPDRPIEFIVMWPAGGGADTATRIFTERLEQVLATDIVVRNMPGGGGSIGYTAAKAATPDGYTLTVIQGDLPKYEPMGLAPIAIDDFDIFAGFAFQSPMLVVRGDSEWESLEDFVAAAKANPGSISVGTTDIGGVFHQPLVLFTESAYGCRKMSSSFTLPALGLSLWPRQALLVGRARQFDETPRCQARH